MNAVEERRWRILAICAVGLFAAFRLAELTRYALWYDELFSLTLAQLDWGGLLRAAVHDRTNPPLFYLLLKAWIGVGGTSVAWMRLLPCLIGIAAAVPLAALARRIFSAFDARVDGRVDGPVDPPLDAPAAPWRVLLAAAATLAAAAASPLHVLLSNELRGYSLLLLLAAISLLCYWRVVESAGWLAPGAFAGEIPSPRAQAGAEHRRRVVLLAVVNVLLAYTHYFGWLLVLAECGEAALWRRPVVKAMVRSAIAAGVVFAPWMVAVALDASAAPRALANVEWIARPPLGAVPAFYDALVARVPAPRLAWLGALVMIALFAALAVRLVRGASSAARVHTLQLAWFAGLPVVLVFIASLLLARSAFVPRYMIVAAPAWWLLMGLAASRAGGPARGAATVVALGFGAFTLASGALREVRGGEKIAWDRIAAAVAADAGRSGLRPDQPKPSASQPTPPRATVAPEATVVTLEGFTALPLAWYGRPGGAGAIRLHVRRFSDMREPLAFPAWLVVRGAPRGVRPMIPGPIGGAAFDTVRIAADSTTDQLIVAYRLIPR